MIVITGYSHKMDGFVFVSDKDTKEEAIKDLLSKRTALKYEEVEKDMFGEVKKFEVICLKEVDNPLEQINEDGFNWGGWQIYTGKVNEDGFAPEAVCW